MVSLCHYGSSLLQISSNGEIGQFWKVSLRTSVASKKERNNFNTHNFERAGLVSGRVDAVCPGQVKRSGDPLRRGNADGVPA